MSAQSKAALQAAGAAGKSAMNAAAGTVNAQIDTGTLDGAAYAAQLAKGIAEIKAAQQKQLEEQLKLQAQAIKAQQKAAAKANAKAEKKQEQAEQSVQAEQGVQDDENAAKGQWTPWGEQSPVVGPVRSSGSTKKPSEETTADETKEEKKGLWQKFEEWGRSELPAEQQLHEELRQKVAEAEWAQTDEKAQKVAELKALNRSQAKARAESRAARETNAGLLNKSKLNDSEKAEIYTRVNTWAENPENKSLMTALTMAKTKNRVGDLLEAGYTSKQLDEANEMLELYQKMGKGQVLKERVGGTAKGTVKTAVSAGMMGADTAMQTAENAVASVKDEEYRNAAKRYNDALLKTQTMEDSNTAYTLDENGNTVQTEEYQKAWQQLNDARAVMDRKDKEINAPVSKDTSGYKMYQSAQEDLSRSDLGLDAGTKMLKGAVTSAAENIAVAAVNPALVLPVLSAQGAAGGMANSIEKEAPAVNTLSNGMAKFMAGWAINSVGVEQMLDSMGASGARNTIAAQIVQSIKNNSKLAQTNPAFYAVLMGAGDNGLQSFAETWADRVIDLATNTADPMSLQELAAQSLQEAASGALGGAMTAVAGLGVNAGRQAAYERAQARQETQTAAMQNETAVNDNPATHTEVQMNGIEKYKQSVDPGMVSFIENVRSGNYTEPYVVSETNDRMRSAMQALSGLGKVGDVTILDDNGVQHIDKRHGVNGEADKTMSKTEDMARAAYVLQSFDNAYLATDKAEGYRTARGKRAPIIIFDKKIDGTHIVVEAVSDSKKNRNYIVSEYLSKNGVDQTKIARVWQAPMDAGNIDPRDTSKTLAATPLAENSVSQTDISVNENYGENAAADRSNGEANVTGDIAALKDILESDGNVTPDIGKMFVPNGSTEEMKQRKQENRKALAQMLGVEENEIPTTLKAAREYLAKVDASKLVVRQAQGSQSPAGQNSEMQSNAVAAGAAEERAGSEPMLRAVPMESVPEEMQQVAREISESTGARVEYFESDNPRALGAYENGTLSLNKNLTTKEAAQQTIVHEFTHWMEGTNTYSKMRQYMMDSRILQEAARAATGLNEPPQGMSWAEAWQQKILEDYAAAGIQADAEKEMVAKMCEKYLFSGEDAVNKICHENMNMAETVLDWVREMISRVRGATMEAELRHIERLYRKGIAEAKGQAEQENKEKQYKVLEDAYSGQSFVQVDEDILNGVPKSQWAKTVREEMKRRYPNGVKIGGWTVHVNADSRSEFVNSKSSQWMESKDRTAYKDKLRMISNLEEIINIANNVRNEGIKHKRKDNYKSFNRAEALIRVGGNGYVADVVTAIKPSTKEVFYDIVNISRQKIKENRPKRYSAEPASTGTGQSSFGDNIAPDDNIVKPGNGKQFSIADTDSEENALAERQRAMEETAEKAFAKSEVRDENGKLLPVYHATDESFTRFSKNKLGSFTKDVASDDSMFATAKMGFWFNEKDLRERTAQSKSIKAYLNIENPYETSLYELANLLESSEGNTPGKKAENLRRELQDQGYDGLAVQDDEFGGKSYVAFEPNQIKSAEPVTYNNSGKEIPLSKRFNKNKEDIRFSLADTDSDGNTLTAQQRSYFKDSKIVDEDGNLRVVYHGSSENFNTFDVSKGRANMDIQGSFFSPWDIDAQGYGDNVRAFYLNIKNPAPEGVAYKALNAHKGENGAGIKARKDLIRMGYDGVNNSDEEYIAFYPEQIKLIDNETPTKDTDIRFSLEENEGTVSREEISRGRFARAAKARENGDSMLRALFVEEDIAEETMRVMETVRNESWRILRDTEESQRTAGQKVLDRSANGIAWALKREYHSSADRAGLKEKLIGLYADMEGKNITMEEAIGRAREIGRELVQTARPERRANTELMDAYGDAYRSATEKTIKLTDSEMQSLLYRWGSMKEFRRDTGNKIRVSTEDGVPIDALWGELSETNPGKFAADTNDGDMLGEIADFVNELRPQEVQRYAGVEQETAEEIGERIIDGFVDGKVRTEKERVRKEVQKEVRRQVKKGVERLNADNYEYRQELGKEKKKIERMAERMGKKLARPTKQQHIVADADVQRVVQSIADDALAIVTGRFAGEDKLPYVGRKLVALSNSLKNLATTDHRYAGFMTVDADGNDVPVEFVRNLNDLAETMDKIHKENPSISDLDLETARKLRETLERVEHELETADKLLSNTIGAEHRESVEKTAKQIYKEIDGARKVSTNSKSVGAKILRALDDKNVGYALTILNPMRVARMMTNYSKDSAFVEVVDALNKGQRKMMLLKGQASAIFADVTNSQFTLGFDKNARRSKTGLGYTKADYDGFSGRNAQRLDVGFRDADTGEVVYITPAMRAELAMHLMNPHNRDRVLYGGLMVPDAEELCKGDTEKAQRLSHYVRFDISNPAAAYEIVAKVVDGMSDYENQWVKAAQRYFWDFSGKEYNKTTVQLWGYEAANVANYYPAASDDKNLHKNVAQRSQENYTVENNSNLKDRVYDATKPIALNEINRTTLKSIDTMSRFCGLALPMRDFEKIYNYNSEFTASGSSENIKSAMNRAWNGKAGIYWENALEDMNGGRSKRKGALSRFFAKARGNYATAVLYGNASTAMKQAASFPTAAAAIGWKPLADGLANYNKEGTKTLEEINKRVATYSMRNGDGNSVYDTGDTSGAVARLVNSMPGAGWITAADDLTVKVLSTAAKAYVDQNIGSLEKGSTEYWDKVADVYADCIELTQPNNGTMQLSALSRSQHEILRGVTMFSNQRIQNLGLMWDAVADLRAQKARLKDAPNDADAKAEFSRAKEKFANTMSAMAVQSLMIGLMTAAGRALWHREDEYRDELGEITSKSLWKKIADDSLDSFMSNFIGIADIVDVGRFFVDKDYTHYDFSVPELEMINGLVTKGRNMVVAISAALENDDPEKAAALDEKMKKSVLAFVEQAGQSLGVPLVNLRKNVLGVFNGVRGIAEGNGWFGEYQYTAKNVRSMISGYMDGRYDLAGANEMLEKYCVSKYGKAFGDMEKSERDKAASDMREQIAKDWKGLYVQATDEERAELAEKLGDIRVGDRKLFTSKAMQAWVDSAEKTAQEKATKDRADRLYADAVDGLAGQRLYKNMSEEEQIDLESSLNEAAKTAAKLEAGYMKAENLGTGERYLWNYAGKNADKWLALKAKYAAINQKAKGGADGTVKMEAFLRALESSGYSTEEQGALLQAKGGNSKLEKIKAETRISYYRAKVYGDTDGNGSLSQSEFKDYVAKSGMSRSTADEIWNMLWAPGENGSSSPYQ